MRLGDFILVLFFLVSSVGFLDAAEWDLCSPRLYKLNLENGIHIETDRLLLVSDARINEKIFHFVARDKSLGHVVGGIGFDGLGSYGTAPLHVVKVYEGKGFGTEMKRALMRFGFENFPIHRFLAMIGDDNTRSIRMHRALGFQAQTMGYRYEKEFQRQYWLDRGEFTARISSQIP